MTGVQLVADFQTAFVAVSTSQMAQFEAERTEQDLLQQLTYWSHGGYLSPGTIDNTQQQDISRASLDAHVKKVQSEQVGQMSQQQVAFLSESAKEACIGRKVTVGVLQGRFNPVDVVWFNPQTGYRSNEARKQTVSGVIKDVVLEKNMLLLEPPRLQRMLNRELTAYIVYVIDPETAQPAVTLTLS